MIGSLSMIGLALISYHLLAQAGVAPVFSTDSLLTIILVAAAVISFVLGHFIGHRMSRQVERLEQGSIRIANGDLTARIPVEGHDELTHLAAGFNAMAERLERATNRERALETARRELVANVAHDLRTPLAAIRASVESVRDGVARDPDQQTHYLEAAARETDYLGRLIDDLFALSQIEAGQYAFHPQSIFPEVLVQDCLVGWMPQIERRRILLAVEVPADLPSVRADPHALRRVLDNLLQNALNHTPDGGQITLRAEVTDRSLQLGVKDTGPGISAEDLLPGAEGYARLFERFYRGSTMKRAHDGAGLGLTIARELIIAQGGDIRVETSSGAGTTFILRIPLN